MSFFVSDGIGSGMPGRLTPLCDVTIPPTSTSQSALPRSTLPTRSRTAPSSISTSCPGWRIDAEHGRRDREVAVAACVLAGDRHVLAAGEHGRRRELSDAQLRPLQVGDQRHRPARLLLRGADDRRGLGVVFVRAVREVEPRAVDQLHQRQQHLLCRRGGPDRRHDLRPARLDCHRRQATGRRGGYRGERGRRPSRDTRPARRAPPRSGAAGCTSPRGLCGRGRPS